MRSLIVLFLTFIFKLHLMGQSFSKNEVDVNIGAGVVPCFRAPGQISAVIGNLSFDYGIFERISVGIFCSYAEVENRYPEKVLNGVNQYGNPSWESWEEDHYWKMYILNVRGAYHFKDLFKSNKLDLYVGLSGGNNFVGHSYKTGSPFSPDAVEHPQYSGGLIWSVFGGCRYRYNERAGLFVEAGYGITYANLGLTCKFSKRKSKAKQDS